MSYAGYELSSCYGKPVECYRFAQGANVWLYTSADADATYGGEVYATTPISRTGNEQNQEDWSGSIEITLPRDNAVALLFAEYLPVSPVSVTLHRFHRAEPAAGVVAFVGTLGSCRFERSQAIITALPLTAAFRRQVPWQMFQGQCNHPLYGPACGVNRNLFKVSATVTGVNGQQVTAVELAGQADGWWNNGWMQTADTDIRWIVSHTGDTVVVVAQFQDLSVGDVVDVYAGCDRTEAACNTKFSNLASFGGWSRIPTKNPFDSSLT